MSAASGCATVPLGGVDFQQARRACDTGPTASEGRGHGDSDPAGRLHRRRVDPRRRGGDRGPEPGHRRAAGDGRGLLAGPGRRGRGGRRRGLPGLAQGLAARAGRALPRGVRHLHGARRRDRRDDHEGGREDHPRVARGDGRVHGRPLPARVRGRPPPRRPGAPLHAGALERQADHRHAGARRRRRGRDAVELPRRHRRDPDRLRPRGRLHHGLEAVRACAALRQHVRRGHPRRRLPGRDAQRRPRARRGRVAARAPPGRRRRRLHRLDAHRRAGRPRRRPQEPRARAGRQRAADRPCRREHREGRGRRHRRLLLPRRAVLHGGRAHPRARVREGRLRRGAGRAHQGAPRRRPARRGDRHGPDVHARGARRARRSTSTTRSPRARPSSSAAATTASSTSRRSSTASPATCGSRRRRRSGRSRRS